MLSARAKQPLQILCLGAALACTTMPAAAKRGDRAVVGIEGTCRVDEAYRRSHPIPPVPVQFGGATGTFAPIVRVDLEGERVVGVQVIQSSRDRNVDRDALAAVRRWRYICSGTGDAKDTIFMKVPVLVQ